MYYISVLIYLFLVYITKWSASLIYLRFIVYIVTYCTQALERSPKVGAPSYLPVSVTLPSPHFPAIVFHSVHTDVGSNNNLWQWVSLVSLRIGSWGEYNNRQNGWRPEYRYPFCSWAIFPWSLYTLVSMYSIFVMLAYYYKCKTQLDSLLLDDIIVPSLCRPLICV